MTAATKDTIYIDIDDEITSIIDKLSGSEHKIVALVLPKRASVFQSLVNMKLLKKAAEGEGKKAVLITSESSILPIAGVVGVYVAPTLQTKPAIPSPPDKLASEAEITEAETPEAEPEVDLNKSVGELAGQDEPAIELDNTDETEAPGGKKKTDKKFKIPNFNRFRVRLFIGIAALILLIVGWIFGAVVLPKATITIATETSSVTVVEDFTASVDAKEADMEKLILPAERKEVKKTEAEKVPATGEKNLGEKASGTMSLKNCSSSVNKVTLPSGTTVSSNSLVFVIQEDVDLPATTKNGLNQCTTSSETVDVLAQEAGDKYNLSARSYTVSGQPDIQASGSVMSGGTNRLVKVVSDADLDSAKQKIAAKENTARSELLTQLSDGGLFGLSETYKTVKAEVTSSPKVGDEAGDVTVTVITSYSMLGVKTELMETMISNATKEEIDTTKQTILNTGLQQAKFRVTEESSANVFKLNIESTVVAGAQLRENDIREMARGKKRGFIESELKSRPGVKEATVQYSPFWVMSTPKKASKITVVIQQVNTEVDQDAPTDAEPTE